MTDKVITQVENKTLATQDFVNNWLDWERVRGQSPKTLEAYRRGFNRFAQWLKDNDIMSPDSRNIADFRDDLNTRYSVQTVNLSLTAVRCFYRYLVESGAIPYSPAGDVRGIKRSKSKRHKRSSLTRQEVLAVLDACDESVEGIRDKAIIMLMAYCALRIVEVSRADLKGLRTEADRMILDVQGKGRREADEIVVIPLDQEAVIRSWIIERKKLGNNPALFVSLSKQNKGERLSTRAVRDAVMRRFHKAGVINDDKTTHSLRHTAITNLIKMGGTAMQAQALGRHESFDTTLGYIHEVNRLDNPPEDLIKY